LSGIQKRENVKDFGTGRLALRNRGLVKEDTLSEARLDELVAGMTAADESPPTVVAHCRMHQLIGRKPKEKALNRSYRRDGTR